MRRDRARAARAVRDGEGHARRAAQPRRRGHPRPVGVAAAPPSRPALHPPPYLWGPAVLVLVLGTLFVLTLRTGRSAPHRPPTPMPRPDPSASSGRQDVSDHALNMAWVLVCAFLVMFMQLGFAMVETGFSRTKNAVHTMAMNLVIYPVGVVGFWLTGYAIAFGGVPGWASLGASSADHVEVGVHLGTKLLGLFGASKFALSSNVADDPWPGHVPLLGRLHGHGGDHPARRPRRAVAVLGVRRLRLLHVGGPLPALRQLGVGGRVALVARAELRPGARARRLRRFVGGAHDGRRHRARRLGRRGAARASASTARTGRSA